MDFPGKHQSGHLAGCEWTGREAGVKAGRPAKRLSYLIQVRHGGDLDLGDDSEGGEKWLAFVSVLKMEPTGLTNRFEVGLERRLQHNSWDF